MGMRDRLLSSPEPWLCYYCGDCSDRCPRGADPGETMMSLRRWLTAQYDFTGFAKRFYTSETFEIAAVAVVAALIGLAFIIFHGPIITDRATLDAMNKAVALNTFAPAHVIEILDLLMAFILTVVLLSNVYRCAYFVMGRRKFFEGGNIFGIPIRYYVNRIIYGIWNMITQWPFRKCSDRTQWVIHLLIFTGYTAVFLMVVGGLTLLGFQRDNWFNPNVWPPIAVLVIVVGWYSTLAIMIATTYAIVGRIKKTKAPYKNSHGTDWMFLILLQLTTITGILVHLFIAFKWPMPTYLIYVVHLMVAVPMLVLEVPFAKWAHLAYRPVALFLLGVKADYEKDQPEFSGGLLPGKEPMETSAGQAEAGSEEAPAQA
jgi:hypothetical protein